MDNKGLANLYNEIYRKGESSHYTKLLFAKGDYAHDRLEVLRTLSWKGKTVLDAGCGTGELAYLIAARGAKHVRGIDYSHEAIACARGAYTKNNLSFEQGEIMNTRGRFDAVVCLGTLEHMDDPLGTLRCFKKILAPGGSMIVSCPNWVNPRGYILLALRYLFGAPITLADLHYLTPVEFEAWAKKLKMKLIWRTVDHDWAHGEKMIRDFARRLPKVIRDGKLRVDKKRIKGFLSWLSNHAVALERDTHFGGAIGIYHFRKNAA